MCGDGTLVCTYRESLFHLFHPFSSWSSKRSTEIRGHICPGMIRLRSGAIILGASRFDSAADTEVSYAFRSTDAGSTWSALSVIAPPTGRLSTAGRKSVLDAMEPTFVELESGLVVCYLREDAEGRHAYKCFSPDEGTTWDGPYPTSLVVCRAGGLRPGCSRAARSRSPMGSASHHGCWSCTSRLLTQPHQSCPTGRRCSKRSQVLILYSVRNAVRDDWFTSNSSHRRNELRPSMCPADIMTVVQFESYRSVPSGISAPTGCRQHSSFDAAPATAAPRASAAILSDGSVHQTTQTLPLQSSS